MDYATRPAYGSPTTTRKRSRSPPDESDAASSSGSSAWSDLDDDNWLSKPDRPSIPGDAGQGQAGRIRHRSVTPERISSSTPLGEANIGMRLLKLMGWSGGGLGANGTGRAEPIPLPEKMDGLGLGKANIETRMLDEIFARRAKVLESQKIANETEEQRAAREANVASKAEVAASVQETLSKFFCDICSKGYANVGQWEEHLLSYGHNHAKRKREVALQTKEAKNSVEEVNKRREKEKKREQKELERMLKAAGGSHATSSAANIPKPPSALSSNTPITAAPAKKPGGFFKVAGASSAIARPPAPPAPTDLPPPPPPPPGPPDSLPPPPPPLATAPSTLSSLQAAPKFKSSASSSLASTSKASSDGRSDITSDGRKSSLASTWQPASAPGLHPLLAGQAQAPPIATGARGKTLDRNDFFRREDRTTTPYELPTMASSIGVQRAPKGMTFVASNKTGSATDAGSGKTSISLAGTASTKKKPLDMDVDDEDEDTGGMPLPTGRPRAMPANQKGKIAFGFRKLG